MNTNKKAYTFVFLVLAMYGTWYLLYELWISPHTRLDIFFKDLTGDFSHYLLDFLGYDAFYKNQLVSIDGRACVSIGVPCNAVPLYALFSIFILASSNKKSFLWKLIFLVFGNVFIFKLNVIRIVLLALHHHYAQSNFEQHHFVFNTVVWTAIFFMWVYWLNHFANFREENPHSAA